MAQAEVAWSDVFDGERRIAVLPDASRVVLRGVAVGSPEALPGSAGRTGPRVQVVSASSLRSLEIDLYSDLALQFVGGLELDALHVSCPGSVYWFSYSGGTIDTLSAHDTFLGGCWQLQGAGDADELHCVKARSIEIVCDELNSITVGWLEAENVTMIGGGPLHISDFGGAAGVQTRTLSVESGRVSVESYLHVDLIRKHTTVSLSEDARLVLGGVALGVAESRYLTVEGGTVHVKRGEVQALDLAGVFELQIGDPAPEAETMTRRQAAEESVADWAGHGLATAVSGATERLVMGYRAVIAGHPLEGFSAVRIEADASAEISGLDADSFNFNSAPTLLAVRRLGLWVPPSTRRARHHYEHEVRRRSAEPDPALFDLAHKRRRLLQLAKDTMQDGHTLSVLREAEKDARRASLPLRSRERLLLELWRRLLGYGERIGYPLGVGAVLIALLGATRVGWPRILSADWWSKWDTARLNNVVSFSLPGVDILGLEGAGGLLGVVAKAVSVVFIGSAITAAVRVAKRSD